MKFAVNLARAPRENRRRAWVLWGGSCALAAVALVILAVVSIQGWRAAASIRARTRMLQARTAPLRQQRQALVAALSRPSAHAAVQQAQFLNQLIDQKAVSWTRLFERLEALLPAQVQLLSIRPAQQQGGTALQMVIAAPDVAAALPFLRHLEEAPDFASPQLGMVSARQNANDGDGASPAPSGVRLSIIAGYNPRLGPADLPSPPRAPAAASGHGPVAATRPSRRTAPPPRAAALAGKRSAP